jgi:hypothetical protein
MLDRLGEVADQASTVPTSVQRQRRARRRR